MGHSGERRAGVLKCPTLVMQHTKTLTIENPSAATRRRRKFEISMGFSEAIDIIGIKCMINADYAGNTGAAIVDVGLSYLDLNDEDALATQSFENFIERSDLLAVFNYYKRVITAAGFEECHYEKYMMFNPPICLVRDPVMEVNARTVTSNLLLYVAMTVYYVKHGFAQSIITQLLQFYAEGKQFFKTGSTNEYDT